MSHILTLLSAALTILAGLTWLWPATRRWLQPTPDQEPLVLAAGFGFSAGALSLYMLALGLLPGQWLRPSLVLPLPWLVLAYETIRWRRSRNYQLPITNYQSPILRLRSAQVSNLQSLLLWLTLICLGGLLVILINTVSYPFYRYDVLARFAPHARQLYESAAIPQTMAGYPLEVQLLYSFAFMAGGAVNDHLAGLVVVAFAGALVLVTFAAGRAIFSARAGWIAVILLLSSRLFVDWATSGYVDVPSGVYHGLTFLFAWRWLLRGERRWALGAGLMAGLALWTKQSALVLLPALAVVPLLRGWPLRNFKAEMATGLAALAAALLVAGPWYLRNWLLSGPAGVLPAPGAFDAQFVDRSIGSLITFVGDRAEWGPWFSIAALIGIALLSGQLIAQLTMHNSQSLFTNYKSILLLIAFVIPYHLIWWWSFSYQTRYLLVSAPMYAVVAGYAGDWILVRLPLLARTPRWLVVAAAGGLVLFGAFSRLGAVYHLVTEPLQSDDAKLNRLSPELWSLTRHIQETITPGSRLFIMDGALAYWLYEYELHQGFPTTLADLRGFDYLVTDPVGATVYSFFGDANNDVVQALGDPGVLPEVYRQPNGVAIYKVYGIDP